MKPYPISDLFITTWKQLTPVQHIHVYLLYQSLLREPKDSLLYAQTMVLILRKLRRSGMTGLRFRRLLIDRINEAQAVDIFHELATTLLSQPWYFFPDIDDVLKTPDDELARTTFDQFIYADNEYTRFTIAAMEGLDDDSLTLLMARLVASLYAMRYDDRFDPEEVEPRAHFIKSIRTEELQLVAFTFGHVREKVVKRCKNLMSGGTPSGKPVPSGKIWSDIKHQLARTGAFGSFDEVGRSSMYYVLDHLELLEIEAIRKKRTHA